MNIYFDNAATTRVKPEVFKEMIPYFTEEYGNPSSLYTIGRRAKRAVEQAREKVANLINCSKNEIYFTAGGSESDNMALKGFAYAHKSKGNHIITTKIEHPAVIDSCKTLEKQGFEVTYLNVDKDGFVDLSELANSIKENTILISVMMANNEIGTIEPIEEISKIAKKKNIIFHVDAVQAVGNIPIDVEKMGIDMLSLSGHKIYGPKGVGALYVKKGIELEKFINGGHQEKDKRAGTENVAEIVGLGKAAEIAQRSLEENIEHLKNLKEYYFAQVINNIKNIKINGSLERRLPGNTNISFIGVDSGSLLLELDKKGICASAGSACSSGKSEPSHVLTSIGLTSELANSALRVTFGTFNNKWEIDYFIDNLKEIINNLRNF